MNAELATSHYNNALKMAEAGIADASETAAMLTDIAHGLRQDVQCREQLDYSVKLQQRALELLESEAADPVTIARGKAQLAYALQLAAKDREELTQAMALLESARGPIDGQADREEQLELLMAMGLASQELANVGLAKPADAMGYYQCALAYCEPSQQAAEYAILHNNLALLMLSAGSAPAAVREALAVQGFEAGLDAVSADNCPREYAMLQNNLGNALQYADSGHPVANRLRALEAYGEALQLRSPANAPHERAKTLANRANCWLNLPDEPEHPERGNKANQNRAGADYREALDLFLSVGDGEAATMVRGELVALTSGDYRGA